jgi:transcriptional regulator with XRE-family HTH domain
MSDEEGRKLYFREDLIFEVTETISKVMHEKGINKAELSRLAGVSKSNITQLLSGDHNMRLKTIADLLYALDSKLLVSAVPLDIDAVFESIEFNQWIPSINLSVKEVEYLEVNEDVKRELSSAA